MCELSIVHFCSPGVDGAGLHIWFCLAKLSNLQESFENLSYLWIHTRDTWGSTPKQLLVSCWHYRCDFFLNWQHKLSMRCNWKCISCLCQDSKTFAGLSIIMTGSQTTVDNILCTHLFCRWLGINLLSNKLISIKSSGQTIFSIQEIEFTFQWKRKKRGGLAYFNDRNKIIYNSTFDYYVRKPISIMLCQKEGCIVN